LLACKSLVIFLVDGQRFLVSRVNYVLQDFIEHYRERGKHLNSRDLIEIERLQRSPVIVTGSFLLKKLRPYFIPFYETRKNGKQTGF